MATWSDRHGFYDVTAASPIFDDDDDNINIADESQVNKWASCHLNMRFIRYIKPQAIIVAGFHRSA